jgi:hydroxysqualene dehydroxylase
MDRVEDVGYVMNSDSVAVIGGGYAGMAAAVKLAELGVKCVVFESAKVLGGRARKVEYRDTTLDNGQHILSGAYSELLRMMALVGVPDSAFQRVPLRLDMDETFSLHAPNLPAPLHLAYALLAAKGLNWSERFAAIRLIQKLKKSRFKVEADQTVAELLAAHQQPQNLIDFLWQPLTVSALNTPIETASAQVLANVLRDTLAASRAASHLILPKTDLTALFPEPAAQWLAKHGSSVRLASKIGSITASSAGFDVANGAESMSFQSVILAVGPHQLSTMELPISAQPPMQYEPIYTVYLQYPPHVKLRLPMIGCTHKLTQWFFDRGQLSQINGPVDGLIAAVISASGAHEALDHAALAMRAHAELEEIAGSLPPFIWHKVVAEKFATFACTPNAQNTLRPLTITNIEGFYLAGDYVACDYPGTLEAAVRNGIAAAELSAKFISKSIHD